MPVYKVGYFVGSLSSTSINRVLSRALIRLAPPDLEFTEIPIGNLPLYSPDFDEHYPPEATALKEAIARADAVLFVTPGVQPVHPRRAEERHRLGVPPLGPELLPPHPGRRDRRVDRRDRHRGGQQSLRAVLSFCNARQMTSPEAYIHFSHDVFADDGEVSNEATAAFLRDFMAEFRDHVERVLTVLPRP